MRIWVKFLSLAALQLIANDLQEKESETNTVFTPSRLGTLEEEIRTEIGAPTRPDTKDLSNNLLTFLLTLLKKLVRSFRVDDQSLADGASKPIVTEFDVLGVMRDLDPKFKKAADDFKKTNRSLTIAIDKFDDYIDHLVSSGLVKTRHLRRDFLHGLITALYELEQKREFQWLRVIASLPEDLVLDLNLREIAAVKRLLFLRIRWSVPDLIQILNNRIRAVLPDTTWDDLFYLQIQNTGRNVQRKEKCAEYIIRHTTRRPREVMYHACALFKAIQRMKRTLGPKEISQTVAETNSTIINDQIVPEWRTPVPELDNFMNRMVRTRPETVFSMQKFMEWSASLALNYAYYEEADKIPDDWRSFLSLAILFRVGVVGFRASQTDLQIGYLLQGENDYARYIFSHTPNSEPIKDLTSVLLNPRLRMQLDSHSAKSVRALLLAGKDARYDIRICFAPVFFEALQASHIERYIVDEIVSDGQDMP